MRPRPWPGPPATDSASDSASDDGSTIPLILGFFIIAFIAVAGSVAAGDAFVQHRALQAVCDGAAATAASSVDPDHSRTLEAGERYLQLGAVEAAVRIYLGRDPGRAAISVAADVSGDGSVVTLRCTTTSTIAFGSVFGLGKGITQDVVSRARAPVST